VQFEESIFNEDKIVEMKLSGYSVVDIAIAMKCSASRIYDFLVPIHEENPELALLDERHRQRITDEA